MSMVQNNGLRNIFIDMNMFEKYMPFEGGPGVAVL
jgi:hypothetical protein